MIFCQDLLKIFISLIFSTSLLGIEFKDLTEDQKFELYNESCEKEQFANCYQVAHWYLENKRIDPIEERATREEISRLNEERRKIKLIFRFF